MSRRVVAVVQARTGSTRLPGKVLEPLTGRPMVLHVLDRVRRVEGVDDVVLATTRESGDDVLAQVVAAEGDVELVRGSEDNVLSRYVEAARQLGADVVVRVTADCPLLSPRVSARVVGAFLEDRECDYCSNTLERSFPRGLDTEVVTRAALEEAHVARTTSAEREHVTPFIHRRPSRFVLKCVRDEVDRSHLRWTVDVPEDLELVRRIYRELYHGRVFEYEEVLQLLDSRSDWVELNRNVRQRVIGA